eukprot:jgi/Picsp_1/3966/NSC_01478-R1_protein
MWALYRFGFWLRETGQALDRLGCQLQGNFSYREYLNRARSVMNLYNKVPEISKSAFIAPSAVVSGQVSIGSNSSVFYGSVLRADNGSIAIGKNTNVQDGSTVTTSSTSVGASHQDTVIGSDVTIGHQVSIHGSTIGDEALIGMGATILEGSKIEKGAMVAAGAIVGPRTVIPAGEIWGGKPAKYLRALKPEEQAFLKESATHYTRVSADHLKTTNKSLMEIAESKGLAK